MTPEKLGTAKLIEEASLSDDSKVLKVTGVPNNNKTVTIFIRGSNQLVKIYLLKILNIYNRFSMKLTVLFMMPFV
jgi:hypothetical protein